MVAAVAWLRCFSSSSWSACAAALQLGYHKGEKETLGYGVYIRGAPRLRVRAYSQAPVG